jgi:tetratricopeptide (TPR) repeat protein
MRRAKSFIPVLAAAVAACAGGNGAVRAERADGDDPAAVDAARAQASAPTKQATTASRSAAAPASPAAPATSPSGGSAAPQVQASPPRRELSPRGQRLWDEALAAEEEMKRLHTPTDWETLERRWRAVAEAEPVAEAWFNVGVTLDRRRRTDEARAAYRRALDLDPRLGPAAANLALLEEPADPKLAVERWAELARRFPDEALPRARLASLYEAAGQRDEAWRLAREALARDPRSLAAYGAMMRVALARGNADLAHLLALKALKIDDADPEIVSFLGDVLNAKKDLPGALAQWRKAVQLRDDYLPPRYALLEHALAKGLWESVAEQAHAILRSDPTDARVQLVLGVAYRHLGKPDQALAAYDQAEKLGGARLPEVHLARGVLLMKTKEQCEPAIGEFRRYVAAAGPAVAADGPAMKLMRECETLLASAREAEEAARLMKLEAEREAARKAAGAQKASPDDRSQPGDAGEAKPMTAAGKDAKASPKAAESASATARQGPTK